MSNALTAHIALAAAVLVLMALFAPRNGCSRPGDRRLLFGWLAWLVCEAAWRLSANSAGPESAEFYRLISRFTTLFAAALILAQAAPGIMSTFSRIKIWIIFRPED